MEADKESGRALLPVVCALVAHLLVAALLFRVPPLPPSGATAKTSLEEAQNFFIEVDDFPARASPATADRPAETRTAPGARAPVVASTSVPTLAATGAHEEAHAAAATAPPDGPLTFEAPRPPDLGLVGTNRFLPRSEAQTDAFAQKHERNEIIRAAAQARDRALGLGPEGPVLAALADGTVQSTAPVKGRAVFVATTDASGEVVSLVVDDSVVDRPGWAEAARLALEALKGKKLRLPSNVQRSVMRLEVISTLKLPSGHDPGLDVTILKIPIHKGGGENSTRIDLLDVIHAEKITVAPGIQIPVVVFSMDIFRLQGDPVDLGANARRVIHTRALDTTMM